MALQVVNTAMLQCTCGDAPTPLTVTSQMQCKIESQLAGTVMDFAPTANITPFGTCKTLTASASGTPTPCLPATVAPWAPGSAKAMIGGFAALLDSDMLTCTVGGSISVTSAVQATTNVS